jgi:hypothetical protein
MFICFATKSLNDGTKGYRFNFAGVKGLTRKRKNLSRGWTIERGSCTTKVHMGKRTVYIERKPNRTASRRIRHFAG